MAKTYETYAYHHTKSSLTSILSFIKYAIFKAGIFVNFRLIFV